jgi:hypothetical protein
VPTLAVVVLLGIINVGVCVVENSVKECCSYVVLKQRQPQANGNCQQDPYGDETGHWCIGLLIADVFLITTSSESALELINRSIMTELDLANPNIVPSGLTLSSVGKGTSSQTSRSSMDFSSFASASNHFSL